MANYSMSTLFNPLYYVGQNNGRKIRLPLLINSGSGEAICFQGNGGFCRFLCSFSIGTTLLRLTMFCWINSNGHGQLAIGFSPRDLPLDDSIISLDSVLTQNSNLPHDWVVSSLNKSPVEMVSCLVGFSDVITCAMEVVNGLNVSLKLLGCRSFECARMLAEVPPLGSEMFIAAGKTGIEAAFAYEIKGTDLGFLVAIKTQGKENQFAAAFLNVANFMCDDTLDELLDQTKWNILLRQKFAYAKDGEQTSLKVKSDSIPFDLDFTPSSQWNFHSVFACMGI
ncbi:unnamed protein product [Allacma fusca]|uniref:Uncharacterized protein n=1 Tax=Allacma fusca TaxID=39272 RepID=A0A8J2JDQ8_9HEXA|nr:unnamed protein product [Allacma fusca]